MDVTLIGTTHHDSKGAERLEKLLEYIRPDVLTVESTPERNETYKGLVDQLNATLKERGLGRFSHEYDAAYEVRVTRDYAIQHGIRMELVDTSIDELSEDLEEFNSMVLERARNANKYLMMAVFTTNKILTRLTTPLTDAVLYSDKFNLAQLESLPDSVVGRRDRYMRERILRIANPEKKLVHVGGILHVVRTGKHRTLADILPNSPVYKLNYADRL